MRNDSAQSSRCCAIAKTVYPSRRAVEYSTPRFIREQNEQIETRFPSFAMQSAARARMPLSS